MTDIADYTSLVTSEHRDKPKFIASISALVGGFVDSSNLLQSLEFDLDTANDTMLDYIGEWIGFSRIVDIPLNIYFSFDTAGLGFDQGIWFAPFDPISGTTRLDNDSYRRLLKARVGINNWDSTIEQFNEIMVAVFAGTDVVAYATDNQNKTISVTVSGHVPLVLKSLIDSRVLLPKPGGISISVTYV